MSDKCLSNQLLSKTTVLMEHILQRYTAMVTLWLERPPHEQVVGLIPGRDRLKSLKLVVVAFSLGAQVYGNSTMTGPLVSA